MASDDTTGGISGVGGHGAGGERTTPSSSPRLDDDDDDDFLQNDQTNLLTARRRRTPADSHHNDETDNRNCAPNAALESENIRAFAKNREGRNSKGPSRAPTAEPTPSSTWVHDESDESAETMPQQHPGLAAKETESEFAAKEEENSDETTVEQRGDRKSSNQQTRSSHEPTIQGAATVVRRSWDHLDEEEDEDDIDTLAAAPREGPNEMNENQDDEDQDEDELPHENHPTDTAIYTSDETTPTPLVASTAASNSTSRLRELPSDLDSTAAVPLLLPAQATRTAIQVELIEVGYCPHHNVQICQEKQGLWGPYWTNVESNFASGGNCKFCIWQLQEQSRQGLLPSLMADTTRTIFSDTHIEQAMVPSASTEQLSSVSMHQHIPLSPTAAQQQPRGGKRANILLVLLLIILLLISALIVTVTKQGGTVERTSSALNDGFVCPSHGDNIFQENGDGSSASTLFLEADQKQDYWLVEGGLGAHVENYAVQCESGSGSPTTSPRTSPTISHQPSVMPTVMPSTTPNVVAS